LRKSTASGRLFIAGRKEEQFKKKFPWAEEESREETLEESPSRGRQRAEGSGELEEKSPEEEQEGFG